MRRLSSILLVDDDATTNFLNQALLEQANIASVVLVAENGQEALQVLAQNGPPGSPGYPVLILLDVNMPVMNGFEFMEAYEQLPHPQRQAKVMILTTSLLPRDLERVRQLPVADVFDKPLTQEKLDLLLTRHFAE